MTSLLLLGAGDRIYREYVVASLAGAGFRLVLLESAPVAWADGFTAEQVAVDFLDADRLLDVVRDLHGRYGFRGVLTYDETKVAATARLARELGLPGLDAEAAGRCRDKARMRAAFAAAGVPSARSVYVPGLPEALAAAAEIGYPVVVKPRSLAGSIGVVRADGSDELRAAFPMTAGARHPKFTEAPGVLVEEYLDGPEFSVESVVADGVVHACGITEKSLGFPPYFEEVGHLVRPTGADPRHAAILDVVRQAHAALGVTVGATHAEGRWTADGPRMIEVAARLAGDMIPYLVRLSSGVDMAVAAAVAATGGTPCVAPTADRVAAVRILYPEHAGRVVSLDVEPGDQPPPWERLAWDTAMLGRTVALPPERFMSRLGYVVAVDATEHGCRDRLAASLARLRVTLAPETEPARRTGTTG